MAETLIPRCALANTSCLSKSTARNGRTLASASAKSYISARFEKFGFRARSTHSSRRDVLSSAAASAAVENEESMSIDVLRRFFDLNIGKWNGSFYVCDDSPSIYSAEEEKMKKKKKSLDSVMYMLSFMTTYAAIRCKWGYATEHQNEALCKLLRGR